MLTRGEKEAAKQAVGRRVRELRERQGMSPATLAQRAGIPRQYVYDLETGARCSIANVVGVAGVLGVSTDYLLDLPYRGPLHDCCIQIAELDAWFRARAEGERCVPVSVVRCGEYEWRGARYRASTRRRNETAAS